MSLLSIVHTPKYGVGQVDSDLRKVSSSDLIYGVRRGRGYGTYVDVSWLVRWGYVFRPVLLWGYRRGHLGGAWCDRRRGYEIVGNVSEGSFGFWRREGEGEPCGG